MAGDYTRLTFDPRDDHAGVLMQQGRVQLDADWNELIEILDRRWRAETVDVIGRCAVPRETPHGFRIQPSAGKLTIGRGRIYVDGLLAENHGTGDDEFDRVLAELKGASDLDYSEQPYFPNASTVSPLPRTGTYLAYVDVWEREVTALQDSDLVEKAVGVDTATRLQTVWQVRLLALGDAHVTCDTPEPGIPGWSDLIAPSAGRLTTSSVGVPSSDDPCIIPPSGGYRGTEIRLYRVEVHDGGALGTATFKWSRDNGTVATRVLSASSTVLTVERTARDSVLRFNVDDWVEVTDDWRELSGQSGVMRQVVSVDDVAETITLDSPLTSDLDATDSSRHTCVRRWDQAGLVRDTNGNVLADVDASSGLITISSTTPAPSIVLEDGVTVQFSAAPAEGSFHTGDYWVFAARTPDASVEELDEAPPRGIYHHCCRLAVVTFPATVTDCRVLWPPEAADGCACTVCVTPQTHRSGALTIQRAIDQVKVHGGKVCLGPGEYVLERPLSLQGAQSVHVEGQGWKTMLVYAGRGAAIQVQSAVGVTLEQLMVTVTTSPNEKLPGGVAIAVRNSMGVTVQRCVLTEVATERRRGTGIALSGFVFASTFRENFVMAGVGIGNPGLLQAGGTLGQATEQPVPLLTSGLYALDNILWCEQRGISLDGMAIHLRDTRLAGNTIERCAEGGIVATGMVYSGGSLGASRLDVERNVVQVQGMGRGIVVGTDNTRIVANDVGAQTSGAGGDGIVLVAGLDATGIDHCQVLANRIVGIGGMGIVVRGRVISAMIKHNAIQDVVGGGIVVAEQGKADGLSIENNQLKDIDAQLVEKTSTAVGISLFNTARAQVVSNSVVGLGTESVANASYAGIRVVGGTSIQITGNELTSIGPAEDFLGEVSGIEVLGSFERTDITDNVVRRSPERPDSPGQASWRGIRVVSLVRRLGDTRTSASKAPEAMLLGILALQRLVDTGASGGGAKGSSTGIVMLAGRTVVSLPRGREAVAVRGNTVDGYGGVAAVQIVISGSCGFGDNRCFLQSETQERSPTTVDITAGAVLASENYLEGPSIQAMELTVGSGAYTVLGNIATGAIQVNGSALAAPWDALNSA